MVGKLGDPAAAERVLRAGQADLVGVGRGFPCDPALANKMLDGRGAEIVRGNECFVCLTAVLDRHEPIRCPLNAELGVGARS